MEVTLQDDATLLNDVVVIGYGRAKKNDLTGSVTAMKPDEKNHGIITTAQDMIQGKIAGVNVTRNGGEPGGGAQIRIRGGSSLNASNDPLIVIDGLQMDNNATKGMNNPLSLVNPNDIESFTVLKDASATAIYGSRGSNGVIIITTKKGRRNQSPKVTYNGTLSISAVTKTLDVMDANEYRAFIKDYYGEESAAYAGLGDADTDWQDEIYRTAISHDHNVSISGGVGNQKWAMPYRVSVGYTYQQGVLKKSDYNRFTAGFTLNPVAAERPSDAEHQRQVHPLEDQPRRTGGHRCCHQHGPDATHHEQRRAVQELGRLLAVGEAGHRIRPHLPLRTVTAMHRRTRWSRLTTTLSTRKPTCC